MKRIASFSLVSLLCLSMGATCNGLPGPGGTDGTGTQSKQIPAFLPDGVTMDTSELPATGDPTSRDKTDADMLNVGPAQRTLEAATRIVQNFHRLADHAVALGAKIQHDMTDPTQTQVQGSFVTPNGQVTYKADFAAFDFDGDGTSDGSGNAVDTPVAIRVWVDRGTGYQRLMCALVTTKPSTDNLGAGKTYVHPASARADDPGDFQVFVNWDRTDPAHKWNDAFVSGQLRPDLSIHNSHDRVDVRTEASATDVEKTVRESTLFGDNPYGMVSHQASVHFKPGSGFALLDGTATGSGGTFSFSDVCVNLSTQSLATGGECDTFDKQDMSFVDLPTGNETAFPAGFPEQPTF
jgi:hypothetical protein